VAPRVSTTEEKNNTGMTHCYFSPERRRLYKPAIVALCFAFALEAFFVFMHISGTDYRPDIRGIIGAYLISGCLAILGTALSLSIAWRIRQNRDTFFGSALVYSGLALKRHQPDVDIHCFLFIVA
jgi:hypothetical protein